MSKNTARINAAIKTLTSKPNEIQSGTVLPGSIDMAAYTINVLPTGSSSMIKGVSLNTIWSNSNGLLLIPAENSNVIIASIDGPGQWCLIKASDITKAVLTIGDVKYEMDEHNVTITNGNVIFNISDSLFKINTPGESLFKLLKDCFTYLTALTVSTPSGTSSIPVNVSDFNNLLSRLNNLLTS